MGLLFAWHALGMSDMTRNTPESTRVTTADATRAFVPCTSKCCGQSGSHHGFDDCCLLKTSSVCAAVPNIATLKATTSPVMTVCARWRGAGLIFIFIMVIFCFVLFVVDKEVE
jgi:hypothetical protein